jgi:hypothetical protein
MKAAPDGAKGKPGDDWTCVKEAKEKLRAALAEKLRSDSALDGTPPTAETLTKTTPELLQPDGAKDDG